MVVTMATDNPPNLFLRTPKDAYCLVLNTYNKSLSSKGDGGSLESSFRHFCFSRQSLSVNRLTEAKAYFTFVFRNILNDVNLREETQKGKRKTNDIFF